MKSYPVRRSRVSIESAPGHDIDQPSRKRYDNHVIRGNSWFGNDDDGGDLRGSMTRRIRSDLKLSMIESAESGLAGVIIGSLSFQVWMGVCIVSNAAVIGLETESPSYAIWSYVELFFLVVFSVELLFRFRVYGIRTFFNIRNPDFGWNVFDACIVALGLIGTILKYLRLVGEQSGGFSTILRVIRLLRVFRIFRLVRMLKQLYMLVFGFGIAAIATVWVTILFVVMLYVCAVMSVKMRSTVTDSDIDTTTLLNERFPTVRMAMFSLFELMLCPDLRHYEGLFGRSKLFTCFIIIFVIFGSFGMLALLTGVISEAMFEKNTMRLEEDRIQREERRHTLNKLCDSMFDEMLSNETREPDRASNIRSSVFRSEISAATLESNVQRMHEAFLKQGFQFANHDVVEALAYVDDERSGKISKREFAHAICSISEGVQASTVLELHKSIGRRAGQVEKEIAAVIDLTRHRDKQLDHGLRSIGDIHQELNRKLSKLLTLFSELPRGAEGSEAGTHAPQDVQRLGVGDGEGAEAGTHAPQDRQRLCEQYSQRLRVEDGEGQPASLVQSSNCCPICLKADAVDTTALAEKVDAFESVLRQMHSDVHVLLRREKRKAQGQDARPEDVIHFGDKAREALRASAMTGQLDLERKEAGEIDEEVRAHSVDCKQLSRVSESWNAVNFEVPLDSLDRALDLMASGASADDKSLDSASTARSWPKSGRSDDSCVD